jgi:glycosyltransferase involved in cell wall biosynthesis
MAVLRRNIGSGAIVHASSHATANDVREIFPLASVRVVHLGSPPTQPPDSPHTSDHEIPQLVGVGGPYVLAVGTIERRKNLPRLIEAFARTETARSGVRLVIAGSPGDDIDSVRSAIEALTPVARSSVVLLGRVSEATLETLYRHAELLAYPSLDEGFGFPILEAMSRGIPVLGSNRGSIPEITGEAAVLIDPFDVDAISSSIDRLVTDTSLRRSLTTRGFDRCRLFTWQKTADGLLDIYTSASSGSNIS